MKKAVIIEDNGLIGKGLVSLLQRDGFEVHFADNGETGLALTEQHRPAVILCDIAMPKMDGFEVLRRLRSTPSIASTPLIFLTAKASEDNVKRGLEAGANGYLAKPAKPEDILSLVHQYV